MGALIGGPVGLLAGALVGDHLMAQERRQQDQAAENERELERLRSENQRLREQTYREVIAGSFVASVTYSAGQSYTCVGNWRHEFHWFPVNFTQSSTSMDI